MKEVKRRRLKREDEGRWSEMGEMKETEKIYWEKINVGEKGNY